MPFTTMRTSFYSMTHLQLKEQYCLSPSDSAMTDSSEFYPIRTQQKKYPKKHFSILSKTRRGMRPMRSSSSTSITAAQKSRKLRYANTISSTSTSSSSSSSTLCSSQNSLKRSLSFASCNYSSLFNFGPKKGKNERFKYVCVCIYLD